MSSPPPKNVQSLINQAKELYEKSFAKDIERADLPIYCASAPGRVNLIGEHTDYTGGFVLPLAIGCNTVVYGRGSIVKITGNKDSDTTKSCVVSTTSPSIVDFHVTPTLSPTTIPANKWGNYVQGVIMQYLPELQNKDETFKLDMAIAGDVPLGSGLSSSASLEVATAVFLECIIHNNNLHDLLYSKEVKMERAKKCQRAENIFCSVPCGIMDQFVSSAGMHDKLLLIDCRSLDFREVSMGGGAKEGDGDDMPVLVIANSNVSHSLGDGEYPIRVQQCKDVKAILAKVNPDIQTLRDATMDDIEKATTSAGLDGVLLQRGRHVVSENERTVQTADALEKGDWDSVGRFMNASHASMKHDYEVSCKEIDILVDLAQSYDGVYGSRLTGGGFGGCTVTLVKRENAHGLIDYLKKEYEKKTGLNCVCFETSPADGARAITL